VHVRLYRDERGAGADAPTIPAAVPAARAKPAALATSALGESRTSSISAAWLSGLVACAGALSKDIVVNNCQMQRGACPTSGSATFQLPHRELALSGILTWILTEPRRSAELLNLNKNRDLG